MLPDEANPIPIYRKLNPRTEEEQKNFQLQYLSHKSADKKKTKKQLKEEAKALLNNP